MKTLTRIGALVLALGCATAAHAANYTPGYGPGYAPGYAAPAYRPGVQQRLQQHVQQDDPAIKVKAQLAGLRAFLAEAQGGPIDPKTALSYVEKQISPDVDFATMTRMSLGRLAQRLSPEQRAQAQATLRQNFSAKIVEAMGDIRGTRVNIGATRPGQSRGELVVPVRIERWRGSPLSLNFRFYKAKDGWKVFDAVANGQSAVLFYRGWFARQMRGG